MALDFVKLRFEYCVRATLKTPLYLVPRDPGYCKVA